MLTGSCFWKMQPFMQSLQIRWPVPGHIGLSMQTSARAPMESPSRRSSCISEIFSSSGQPFREMPSGFFCQADVLASKKPLAQESFSRSWQSRQ